MLAASAAAWRSTSRSFMSLPAGCFAVLIVECVNTLRGRTVGTVLYQMAINEYGLSELETSQLMSVSEVISLVFALLGAPLVDGFGVRRVALCSLAASTCTTALLAFGRSTAALTTAVLLPADVLLGLAMYSIALKNLTTPLTRPVAFAFSSGLLNVGVVAAFNLVELVRRSSPAVTRARLAVTRPGLTVTRAGLAATRRSRCGARVQALLRPPTCACIHTWSRVFTGSTWPWGACTSPASGSTSSDASRSLSSSSPS